MSVNSRRGHGAGATRAAEWIVRALFIAITCALPGQAAIQITAVTSSTDFQTATLLPGSLATVWCTGLTGISGVVQGTGPVLPTQLAGVSVMTAGSVNGVPSASVSAPILAIADLGGYQQINIQVPWEAEGFNTVTIRQGAETATTELSAGVWPGGVFFVDSSGHMVAQHAADFRVVTTEDPARAGEWILGWGSNLGRVSNTPPTGTAAPLSPLSPLNPAQQGAGNSIPVFSVVIPPADTPITYSSTAVESNYIGLAPGMVGVYQINFRIPENPPAGEVLVYVRRNVDCGFFFLPGCGRGFITAVSTGAKLPIAP